MEKNRYRIPAAEPGLAWEVDEYFGANAPLVTAEIELPDEKTLVELPEWIGREVTTTTATRTTTLPCIRMGSGAGERMFV